MNSNLYLIDSTVWINFLRTPKTALKDKLSALILEDRALTTEIIIMEILRGVLSEKEYNFLYEDFISLPRVSTNINSWNIAWKLSFSLKKRGLIIPIVDVILTSLAITNDLTIIHNDKHFKLLANVSDLKEKSL